MKKRGKKTLAWETTRRKLKVAFEASGITRCELRVSKDCSDRLYLSFAHSLKRRFITTQEQMHACVLACVHCHNAVENMSHDEMERVVSETIAKRETPVIL